MGWHVAAFLARAPSKNARASAEGQNRTRKSAQDDKWNFCLTAGTLCPANQERPCQDDHAGTTHRPSRRGLRLPRSRAIEAELAEQFDVHPHQITTWKAQLSKF